MAQAEGLIRPPARVLFWGGARFGIPFLDALAKLPAEFTMAGVVTVPDRPAGRGRRGAPRPMRSSPVAGWGRAAGVAVLQPAAAGDPEFLREAGALEPDVAVVAAYGMILPRPALNLPPLGSFNIHPSLLPALRGAAPVQRAIIAGHPEVGVTIIRMSEKLDAGPVLAQASLPNPPGTTAETMLEELARLGAKQMIGVLRRVTGRDPAGPPAEVEQDEGAVTWAPKLGPSEARIDWTRSAGEIARLVAGCDPVPGSWTTFRGVRLRCLGARVWDPGQACGGASRPGEMQGVDGNAVVVAAGEGCVELFTVQPAGKRLMDAAAWWRGAQPEPGERFN